MRFTLHERRSLRKIEEVLEVQVDLPSTGLFGDRAMMHVEATRMNNGDQILRAYAAITSIRANVPERHEVEERWVNEFNTAIEKLEKSLGIDLQEFKVPRDALKRFVASCNSLTNDVTYLEGQWCELAILMQKLYSVLVYFTGLEDREDNKIGFHPFK
jgi:hypothetical protein